MKALRLSELQELIQSQPFAAWWADYQAAVDAAREARLHDDDVVAQAQMMELRAELAQRAAVDVFTLAGETQDAAARTATEAQALENQALVIVGHYEDQRFRTSDAWYRLGGAERAVEVAREAAADGRPESRASLEHAERARQAHQAQYDAEDARRTRLWAEVEATWEQAFSRSLVAAETELRARRVRQEAERLFKEAEERRARARQLRADADAAGRERAAADERRAGLLALAGERFGCTPGDSFLYWRHGADPRSAFAVALVDEPEGHGLPVKPLAIFTVTRPRGVAFLEPARAGATRPAAAGERRLEDVLDGLREGASGGGDPPDPAARP
ncbi:MAG TPA: hypothetical protein VLT47_06170 [Anaeromyxobacteraceae bacterium]|nr:hypothetical protein [Anaeromyxobacteraceae bacterium]